MIFALRAPIDNDFLNDLRKEADVEVDNLNRIIKYEKKGGGFHLAGTHLIRKRTLDTLERDKQMMKFLAEKCKIRDAPITVADFTKEFKESTRCKLTINQLCARYTIIKNNIYNSTEFDKSTRIKMMFISSAAVHEDILKKLRKDAVVEVDEEQRITEYTANDGSLNLKGDHSLAAKWKAKLAEKKLKRLLSDTSEDEDDVNDNEEESEKEVAEEHSDEEKEAEEVDDKENITITRSERMPKNRYPNFSHDSDDDEFESSSSNINRKPAKNENSTGLTPKVSRVKLEKRRIADASSASESLSKIAKSVKTADVQHGRKSVQKSSEHQEEVIYDGPGEPSLPIPLPNKTERNDNYEYIHEENEYKPDLSYLSNPQQYSEENIIDAPDFENSQDLMNHPVPEIVKNEETEMPEIICDTPFVLVNSPAPRSDTLDNELNRNESSSLISSKEFLKVLLSLVQALNSLMLTELRKQIDNAIEKLGENDQKVPIDYILMSLNSGLYLVTKNASLTLSQKDSASLKEFLQLLRLSLFFLNSPTFDNFQKKLEDTIKELGDQDKNIPIEKIQTALKYTFDIAIP